MKSLLRIAVLLVAFSIKANNVNAQVPTTVTVNPGYTNQTFYSMSNGTVSSVTNLDWDIAFQLRGFAASILINSKSNVKLFNANKAATDWSTMVANDTTGVLSNPANELVNSDTSWDFGAFNRTNDTTNAFDLGWGVYDFNTHAVIGDSVYYIKLSSGIYKKLQIMDLASGVYTFRFADVDGSNEQTRYLAKITYAGKFFAYYNIQNDVAIDREPVYNAWDLSFQQYLTLTPYTYKVTGVLSNDSVFVAKAYPVDISTATSAGLTFHNEINTIGYDWKTYDMNTNSYIIADSTVYFVTDRNNVTWKVVFTGFGGSANGNFYFDQSLATSTALGESVALQTLGMYPNPASGQTRMMVNVTSTRFAQLAILDVTGRVVRNLGMNLAGGVQAIDLELSGLNAGIYNVVLSSGTDRQVSRLVVN